MAHVAGLINHLLLSVARMLSIEVADTKGDPQGFNQTIRQFYHGLETSMETAAEPWTVAEIARACRVGVSYLTASCREMSNPTPGEQLTRIRLEHATGLLVTEPDRSITEVAFAVGFNSSQYFATRFRKLHGQTPHGYREQGAQSPGKLLRKRK